MADEDVSVGLSANIADLLAGFNQAATSISASLASIEERVSQAAEAIEDKITPAAEHAAESLHHMEEESAGVGGALEEIKHKMNEFLEITGVAAAYEIFEKVKEKLEELTERAIQFGHAAEILGISIQDFQGLAEAGENTGISMERVERTMFVLQQRMTRAREEGGAAAEKFNQLGISNQMLGDSAFGAVDALQILGNETNSNADLIGLLGARMAAAIPMIREMAKNHELLSEEAQKVNALLPSEVAQFLEFHKTMNEVKTTLENFLSRVLLNVIPAMKELVEEFKELTEVGPVAQFIFDAIGMVIKEIITEVTALAYAFKGAMDAIVNGLNLIATPFVALGNALNDLVHGRFDQAKQDIIDGFHNIGTNWHVMIDEFNKDVDRGEAAVNRMKTALSGLDEFHPNLERKEEPKQESVGKWDNSAYMAMMKDRIRIHKEMIAMELKDDDEYLNLATKGAIEEAKAQQDITLGQIKIDQMAIDQRVKNEMFGNIQELGSYKALIQQKLDAELQRIAIEKSLAEAEGRDTKKFLDEETKARAAAAQENVKVEQKAAQEIRRTWDGVFRPIESSFSSSITRMIEGTESFGAAWRNVLGSILDTFIRTIANMIVQWLMGMLENLVVSKTTAASQIMANAGVAASAAAASVAAIPFVGWAMAPEVAATTFAETAAYSASISAAGGADIPAGVNPRAQLHEKEMVLPANIADPLRQMISGGGGSGRSVQLKVMNGGDDHFVVRKADMAGFIKELSRRNAFGTRGNF